MKRIVRPVSMEAIERAFDVKYPRRFYAAVSRIKHWAEFSESMWPYDLVDDVRYFSSCYSDIEKVVRVSFDQLYAKVHGMDYAAMKKKAESEVWDKFKKSSEAYDWAYEEGYEAGRYEASGWS